LRLNTSRAAKHAPNAAKALKEYSGKTCAVMKIAVSYFLIFRSISFLDLGQLLQGSLKEQKFSSNGHLNMFSRVHLTSASLTIEVTSFLP